MTPVVATLDTALPEIDPKSAELLGVEPPAEVSPAELSPMARSFYENGSRRVRNARIKEELGVALRYPDYRAGLRGLERRGLE